MSPPSGLIVQRYRAFADEARLPLRPLTLLYGRNNCGKSALVRALAILGASVSETASSAFVRPTEIDRDGEFTDWAWQGDVGDYSFDIGLCWNEGALREARFTIDGASGRQPYVKELQLRGPEDTPLWLGRSPPNRPMRPQLNSREAAVSFVGLVPAESKADPIQQLRQRLHELRGKIYWLDGVRARPERRPAKTGSPPDALAPAGGNAVRYLIERPELLDSVRRFYAALSPPRDLRVQEELNLGYRIRLDRPTGFAIDLIDTGEGMSQVLPVLVAASLAAEQGPSAMLAVEEPESHLHPDAQACLADHLCAIAAQQSPPTMVLETHSRVFLLAVQLAVARGQLRPERVSLTWIDQDPMGRSTITPVELDEQGHPRDGWPAGALAADLRLAAELARHDLGLRG